MTDGVLASITLISLLGYFFLVSAGFANEWPSYSHFSDSQAEGFRAGQLSLTMQPRPELLQQANPFDHKHVGLWVWDLTLHGGRYYMYWGPAPAAMLALVKTLLRLEAPVGDEWVVLVFLAIQLIAGVLLLRASSRKLLPDLPGAWLCFAAAAFAWANPTPWMLGRASIYEVAIMGGQAFLMLGLLLGFYALTAGTTRRIRQAMGLAGLAWGIALAARISLAPTVALLGVLLLLAARRAQPAQSLIKLAALLGGPLALTFAVLMAFNFARFENAFESGTTHQLTWMNLRFDWRYIGANLYQYLIGAPAVSGQFPFVTQPTHPVHLLVPSFLQPPQPYETGEPATGMLLGSPYVWWAGFAGVVLFRRSSNVVHRWLVASAATIAIVTMLVPLAMFLATMRYLSDARSGLVLLAFLGAAWVWQALRGRRILRQVAGSLMVATVLLTVAIGALLGTQGYSSHFQHRNPSLYRTLQGGDP